MKTTRREFLKTFGAVSAATVAFPALFSQIRSSEKNLLFIIVDDLRRN